MIAIANKITDMMIVYNMILYYLSGKDSLIR